MAVYFKGDAFPKLIERRKHTRAFSPLFSTSLPPPPFQVSKWQTPTECTYMMITSFYKLDREKMSCQVLVDSLLGGLVPSFLESIIR